VRADGTEAFPHNGSAVSTNLARIRVSPSAAFNTATEETFVFWEEENSTQSQSGVYGQKLDSAGGRQWTDDGVVIVPVGSDENTQIRCLTEGPGAFVFWVQATGVGQDRLYGARLDGAGTIDIPRFDVASALNDKSRLVVGRSASGFAILAWQDDRYDAGDIFAQNINPDGSLGTPWVGVENGDAAGLQGLLGAPWPNPTGAAARMQYSTPGLVGDVLEIFDVGGRVVRTCPLSPGETRGIVTWDGRDASGRAVPGGVYFLRLRGSAGADPVKITVVR
jgi:hypothetical protein